MSAPIPPFSYTPSSTLAPPDFPLPSSLAPAPPASAAAPSAPSASSSYALPPTFKRGISAFASPTLSPSSAVTSAPLPPTLPSFLASPSSSTAGAAPTLPPPRTLAWPAPPSGAEEGAGTANRTNGASGTAFSGPPTVSKKMPAFGSLAPDAPAGAESTAVHPTPPSTAQPAPPPSSTPAFSSSSLPHPSPSSTPAAGPSSIFAPHDRAQSEHDDAAHMLCSLAASPGPAASLTFPSASPPERAAVQLGSPPESGSGASAADPQEESKGGKAKKELKQTKRAQQNRAAQRAFRERKQQQIRDLESVASTLPAVQSSLAAAQCRVAQLEAEKQQWDIEREALRREVEGLRRALGVDTATLASGEVRRAEGEEDGGERAKRLREGP